MDKLKILTLNIKSLSKNFRHVILLIKRYNPDLLFLQETYIVTEKKANDLKVKNWTAGGLFQFRALRQRGSNL